MKKKYLLSAVLILLLFTVGCEKSDSNQASDSIVEPIMQPINEPASEDSSSSAEGPKEDVKAEDPEQAQQEVPLTETRQPENAEAEFHFEDLSGRVFDFSSGAGGWWTELSINKDGSFQGTYMDSDMGDNGDTYPNGTLYYCEFSGMFDQPEKVDSFTYKVNLSSISFKQDPNKEEIIDGVRYIYSTAYGLDGGNEFLIYLPGSKLSDLPEDYRGWVGYYYLENTTETQLPFYGLYNVNTGDGFSSHEYEEKSLSEKIALEISFAIEQEAELEEQLQNSTTQTDMNLTAQELFQTWDDTLNIVWKLLESELDDTQMEALREDERNWITFKEETLNAISQESEGASMGPMDTSLKAAELTKNRVYELADYADQ
ncbi:MAG: DUF1311 domain-containing protein [Lachnospiraceae bacterium]|nr:DUF1311 domain-containing protein [Lachnospiraceae bacterium]